MRVLDGIGIYGQVLHYALLFVFTGGALFVMLYFWRKGLLSFGEEPSVEMLKSNDRELPED